jgi:hypothetical protein
MIVGGTCATRSNCRGNCRDPMCSIRIAQSLELGEHTGLDPTLHSKEWRMALGRGCTRHEYLRCS